jgi:cystathionine gamma-synthase
MLLYKPQRIAIGRGYFGCHQTIMIYQKTRPDVKFIDLDDEFQEGDLCWLETPLNPTGEARYDSIVSFNMYEHLLI